MSQTMSRKEIARRRVRGLLVFLIVVLSVVLIRDLYSFFKGVF